MCDVIHAFESKRLTVKWKFSQGDVSVHSLCPDMEISSMVTKIRQSDLTIMAEIGRGAYGKVMKATLNEKQDDVHNRKNKKCDVAVKIFQTESYLATYREVYVMSLIDHPNIVHLMGMCDAKSDAKIEETWIVMEYMRGRNLSAEAFDPDGVMGQFSNFCQIFSRKYLQTSLSAEQPPMRTVIQSEIAKLMEISKKASLCDSFSVLLKAAEGYWKRRTKSEYTSFEDAKEKVMKLRKFFLKK